MADSTFYSYTNALGSDVRKDAADRHELWKNADAKAREAGDGTPVPHVRNAPRQKTFLGADGSDLKPTTKRVYTNTTSNPHVAAHRNAEFDRAVVERAHRLHGRK